MLYWENPLWALLFFGLPLLWAMRWFLVNYRAKLLKQLPIPIQARSPQLYLFKTILLSLAWISLVLALMGPMGNPRPDLNVGDDLLQGGRQKPQDVIFLIDSSASMSVNDGRGKNTRLDDAKELAELMIQQLQGQNVALYAFTSELIPLAPPTPDYLFTILALRALKINEGDSSGTQLSDALAGVAEEFKDDSSEKKHTLVVLTDGGDNSNSDEKIFATLKELRKKDWDLVVIGVGSAKGGLVPNVIYQGKPVTAQLEEAKLKKVAETGQGQYYASNARNALDLSKSIGEQILAANRKSGAKEGGVLPRPLIYDRYFQWPLLAAIFFLGLFFFLPDIQKKEEP